MNNQNVVSKEIIIEQAISQNVRGGGTCYSYTDICYADFCSCEAGLICGQNICSQVTSYFCQWV